MSKTVTMSDNARIVEVILYVENEAVSIIRISELSGLSSVEVKAALKELKELSTELNRSDACRGRRAVPLRPLPRPL